MRILPILFNTEMVQAILDGRKTVTRRVVKPYPPSGAKFYYGECPEGFYAFNKGEIDPGLYDGRLYMAPYSPGDILYVRETWQLLNNGGYIFRAGKEDRGTAAYYNEYARLCGGWRPSIHMPKKVARIFLRVTDIRVERLREIDESGAIAEGLYAGWQLCGRGSLALSAWQAFNWLWIFITKKSPVEEWWTFNPWVWVITFERCEKPSGWPS